VRAQVSILENAERQGDCGGYYRGTPRTIRGEFQFMVVAGGEIEQWEKGSVRCNSPPCRLGEKSQGTVCSVDYIK